MTRAICLWLKRRWIDSWKVMIFDWGQISEVIFFAFSLMCPSFSLVSLCDDAGFTFEILNMSTRLPRNQNSISSATPDSHVWGVFRARYVHIRTKEKRTKHPPPPKKKRRSQGSRPKFKDTSTFFLKKKFQSKSNTEKSLQTPSVHVRWDLIQLSARSCLYPRSSSSVHYIAFTARWLHSPTVFIANLIPSEMNTVN